MYTNEQYLERESYEGTDDDDGDYTDPYRKYINKSSGYDLRNSSLLGNHKVTIGTDYTKEEQSIEADGVRVYDNTSIADVEYETDGGEIRNIGVYVEDEIEFDKLILTLGARYDHYKLGGIYSGTFKQLSPKMKLRYQATDNLTLKSAYGRIFKGPALGETLMIKSSSTQGDDTSAQIGNNFEVGFDYSLAQALNADNSVFGMNIYRYNVDDYADTTKNSTLDSQYDITIWGIESMFSYTKDDLGLNVSHTYIGGEQTDADGIKTDPSKTQIHTFNLGLNYQITSTLKVKYSGEFVPGDEYVKSSTSTVSRPGYGVHDINFILKPSSLKDTTFNFGVDNIFDKEYTTHTAMISDTHEVGRNFKFQVSYKF